MVVNRTQFTSGVFVVFATLYAAPLWADQEPHASLAALEISTQEALRDAWFNGEKKQLFFPQSDWLLFRPRESESIRFKHDGIADNKQRARSVVRASPGGFVNTRPGEIPIHDLGTGGIPLWKW